MSGKKCKGGGDVVGGAAAVGGAPPRSAQIASRGIRTGDDAANFLSALIGDVMGGEVKEKTANSACNAMGKLLKVVDMQHRYNGPDAPHKPLRLADPSDSSRAAVEGRRAQLARELAELDAAGE